MIGQFNNLEHGDIMFTLLMSLLACGEKEAKVETTATQDETTVVETQTETTEVQTETQETVVPETTYPETQEATLIAPDSSSTSETEKQQ